MPDKKRFAINMIAQIFAFIVNFSISFLLTPYIVKTIGKEAYGFVGLANNFVSYALLITIALNSMASRFITISVQQNDIFNANKYFSSVFYANLFISCFIIIISIVVILKLDILINIPIRLVKDVRLLFSLVFINFIISLVTSVYGVATFAKNRLDLSSTRSIISNFIRIIVLLICFVLFPPKVWYIGLASIITTIYLYYTNLKFANKLLPELKIHKKNFDFSKIKELIQSGFWNTLSKLSVILSAGLDLLIANLFINSSAMGTLSLAKIIPSTILSVFGALASVYAPNLTIAYANKQYDEMKQQLFSSMKFLGFLASIPIAILFAYGDIFFHLWVPGENSSLIHILSILTCIELCFALPQEGLWNIFTVTNKVKMASINLLIISIFIIISVFITMHIVEPIHRIYFLGSITSFFSSVRLLTFLPIYGAKCLNLKWNTFYPMIIKTTISIVILTGISLGLKHFIKTHTWNTLIMESIMTVCIGSIMNFFLLFDNFQRHQFIKKINTLINRFKLKVLC